MPDAKKARALSMPSEGGITFEQKLSQRSSLAGLESGTDHRTFVIQFAISSFHGSAKRVAVSGVIVCDASKTVGQSETARPEMHCGTVVQPLGQEINSRLAAVVNVRANVEKF